uniref:Uncharacterized protein n=1 Tax=viral metagenome TaxID=1070528 RepID=A0A6M3LU75_9ZZZZ
MEYTKGEWKAKRNALGSWTVATEDTYICRANRHFNAHFIAKSPRIYELLSKISTQGYRLYQADIKAVKDILNDTP